MLATISASAQSGRDVCGASSRLGHGLSRPTSFLIRDILGKCNGSSTSDFDEHNDRENSHISSEEEREKSSFSHNKQSALCCRECIAKPKMTRRDSCEHNSQDSSKSDEEESNNYSKTFHSRRNQSPGFVRSDCTGDLAHSTDTARYHLKKLNKFHYPSSNPVSPESMSPNSCQDPRDSSPPTDFSKYKDMKMEISRSAGLEISSSSEDEWIKGQTERFSTASKTFYQQEQLQRTLFDKLRDASSYSQNSMYNGFYSTAQNLIDFNYAFNLRAANTFGVPHLTLPILSAYRNNLHCSPEKFMLNSSAAATHKIEPLPSDSKSSRLEPYPRYRLLDWPQGRNFSSKNSAFFSLGQREHFSSINQDSNSDSLQHERRGFSLQSTSPTCSDQSQSSPLPEKRPIQLPAYFRSRLGGTGSSEELTQGEKTKKCRRSRTVFTELQMLGLEKRFEKQQYLSTPDRVELAEMLGLSQLQVKTWYQNRRMKWKKQVMQGGGTEPPTKPKGRPRKVRPAEQLETSSPKYDPSKFPSNKPLDLRSCGASSLSSN